MYNVLVYIIYLHSLFSPRYIVPNTSEILPNSIVAASKKSSDTRQKKKILKVNKWPHIKQLRKVLQYNT